MAGKVEDGEIPSSDNKRAHVQIEYISERTERVVVRFVYLTSDNCTICKYYIYDDLV